MKKQLLITFLLMTIVSPLFSQTAEWVMGQSTDYLYGPLSIRNTPLFNAGEVKARGIKTCYIIRNERNWNKELIKIDTPYIFSFDRNGNISRRIHSNFGWDRSGKDTIEGDFSEKRFYKTIDTITTKLGGQTVINEYFIWAFNPNNEIEDTGIVRRTVYDNKGRLLELKQNGTADYHMIYFCGTGMTFDDKYRYDSKDNIVYFSSHRSEYGKFEHHPRRRIVRVYDSLSHKLKRKHTVHVDFTSQWIVEKDDRITILTRLERGSKLFSLLSARENEKGSIASQWMLVYEYFDQMTSKEKLLVKQ